jgi:hypothetical protein
VVVCEQLGETEVKNLGIAASGDKYVGRFDIAVDDAFLVRGLQTVSHLDSPIERPADSRSRVFSGSRINPAPKSLPFEQLHDDEGLACMFAEFMDRTDVGVIQ